MSENNSDITLVHEDYISDNGIDETTLSTEINNRIVILDRKVAEYEAMDDEADLSEIEAEIQAESQSILDAIKADLAGGDGNNGGQGNEGNEGGNDGNDGKEPKKPIAKEGEGDGKEGKKDAPKKQTIGNPLLDTIFGFNK
jgi:hypothetical protein